MVAFETRAILTRRLRLVPLRPDDADEMAGVLADVALYDHIGGEPPTVEGLTARYRAWAEGPPREGEAWHNWVIRLRLDGAAIGHLQATVLDGGRAADIAWTVGVPWQGNGYASEAAVALVEWLGSQGVETITAFIHPGNRASAGVAAHAGMQATNQIVDGEIAWRREVRREPAPR